MRKQIAAGALALSFTLGASGSAGAGTTAPEPVRLQALVPTLGGDAAALLDHAAETGWKPGGDAADEGVLFRFESPARVARVEVERCRGDRAPLKLAFYVDGAEAGTFDAGSEPLAVVVEKEALSSFFLRVERAEEEACVGEVRFLRDGTALDVKPPREVRAKVSASSTLAPLDAYHPAYLFDGRLDFGWVEGAKDLGVGQTLTLEFGGPVEIAVLELWNGYQRSDDHFKKNARARRLSLRADGGEPVMLPVRDASGAQKLALPKPVTASKVVLKIEEAIPGSKYQDLVLSELRLWDAQGPVRVATPDAADRRAVLAKEIAGKPLAAVVDRLLEVVCDGESEPKLGRLKLRTNHTLVWYSDSEDYERTQREVLDGTWVVSEQAVPWSKIELFARRHRTEVVAIPYGSARRAESSRIAGGILKIARVADLGPEAFAALLAEWGKGPASRAVECVGPDRYGEFVEKGAVVVQGKAITELLW